MPGTQCGCARRERETEREREISRLARHSDIVINEQELEEREVEFVRCIPLVGAIRTIGARRTKLIGQFLFITIIIIIIIKI